MWCLLIFIYFLKCVSACPFFSHGQCSCSEVYNGVVLDCSNTTGHEVLIRIRENQASIGLIQSLTLKNSSLHDLSPGLFSGLYIKLLDLSHNRIEVISQEVFSGINPVLEKLFLSHNKLKKVPYLSSSVFPSLSLLDLSNNEIDDIDENSVLAPLAKLRDLNLGSNRILSIHTNFFQNVKNSIHTINLGHNNLSAVPSSAIRGLKLLQSLHLHENNISQLDALAFLNLPVLNLLNLAGNQIQELNRQAFLNVPNLRYVYLSNNKIKTLFDYQFQTFQNLEMLDLTNNTIVTIPKHCFSGLQRLRQLYLGNNRIMSISDTAFVNSSIALLVLSDNKLVEIENATMNGLESLQQVSFRNNKIKTINQRAFYHAPSLTLLDLAQNCLTNLKTSTFLSQVKLLFVDLSENKFEETPYSAFNKNTGTVLLKENPLVCVEKIHMLQGGVGITIDKNLDLICDKNVSSTSIISVPSEPVKNKNYVPRLRIQNNIHKQDDENSVNSFLTSPSRPTNHLQIKSFNQNSQQYPPLLPTQEQFSKAGTGNASEESSLSDTFNKSIVPFPIPFLKMGPTISKAKSVHSPQEVLHTLPPTILVDPGSTPNLKPRPVQNPDIEISKNNLVGKLSLTTSHPNETFLTQPVQKTLKTTEVMISCIGLASVVLLLVIISLCITKHRQLRNRNVFLDSCAAQTRKEFLSEMKHNGYREQKQRALPNSPAWIYNPGSSYCNYYQ